jgi:ABC-type protease/lipase transport system fused ATPase/permease subunit
MDAQGTRRIERLNYFIGALAIGATAVMGTREQVVGMAAGVIISCLNFTVLRALVAKVVKAQQEGRKSAAAVLFLPQMLGLMGAVSLAVFFLPLSPIYLAIGFSVFMVSIAIETARFLVSPILGT